MNTRVLLLTAGVMAATGLVGSASGFEISRTRTEVAVQTSPSGDHTIQLRFAGELVSESGPDFSDDVLVGWQEVGGVEPEPFRVLMPAGCFIPTRRGFRMEDFQTCGVQLTIGLSTGEAIPLTVVDFEARVARRDDGTLRFDIVTTFYPPEPVYPPDPVHAFLGVVGGAAVEIAVGSEMSAALPLRAETVSGHRADAVLSVSAARAARK